ncbi:MAG: Jag N-terminal domain-containing protein [Christensenellaceae bacterium]|nr:Jag N-terminal domain-containing protein [Christensenellaceae bacterium]
MKSYESSAKTIEEAIDAGLTALGAAISDVDVQIIDEGSKGLFGLFGSRLAKVRLTLKEAEEDLLALTEDKPKAKPAREKAPKPAPKAEPKPEQKPAAKEEAKQEDAETPAETTELPKPVQRKPRQPKQPKEEGERPARQSKPKQPKADKESKPETKKPLPPKEPVKPIEKPVITMIPDDQVAADSAAGKAQAFLKELTHLMGVEVEVAVGNDQDGNVFVQMTGDTLGILIGRRGETLDALQYLTSLKVNRGQEGYTRVTLDTENYRAKREETLIRLANRMANHAVKTGRKVSIEPMNPYERRIIHSALQANEAVDTHSEGEEPNRHVVITLRK